MNEIVLAQTDNPFHMEPNRPGFESMGKDNGFRFWYASDLARLLGYESYASFQAAVNRAMTACNALGIAIFDNFSEQMREVDGKTIRDFKLSRFACYLAAMNGDVKKPMVALAQAYFVRLAEAFQLYLEEADGIERVQIRSRISDQERSMVGVAKQHGVETFAYFQNAGYRGLYNMNISQLRDLKGVPSSRSPLDFMGSEEMASNLFRIKQTEAKIKNENIRGQQRLEGAAEHVGRTVRKAIRESGGVMPENLPPAEDIRQVHKNLKSGYRKLRKIDNPKI